MHRLIMLEGLPGTGKTTNSYRLYEQLVRNGRDVRWLHEVSQPHPTLFFSESCLTKEEYRLFTKKYPEAADLLGSIAEVRATTVGDRLSDRGPKDARPGKRGVVPGAAAIRRDGFHAGTL